jgi:flagellar biosynthesis GTPase FlhF
LHTVLARSTLIAVTNQTPGGIPGASAARRGSIGRLTSRDKKIIGAAVGGVLVLCCGGTALIGAFADPPADQSQPRTVVATQQPAAPNPSPTPTVDLAADVARSAEASRSAAAEETRVAAAEASRSVAASRSADAGRKRAQAKREQQAREQRAEQERREREAREAEEREAEEEPKSVYYANCAAARSAGAAPLHQGEPGYRSALDRDKDGVACDS